MPPSGGIFLPPMKAFRFAQIVVPALLVGLWVVGSGSLAAPATFLATDASSLSAITVVQLAAPLLSIVALMVLLAVAVGWLSREGNPDTAFSHRDLLKLLANWLCALWILLAQNSHYFPHSAWAWRMEPLRMTAAAHVVDAIAALWLLYCVARRLIRMRLPAPQNGIFSSLALLCMLGLACLALLSRDADVGASHNPRANLLVIGLDSLRRDIALDTSAAPSTVSELRNQAFVHANVVSPLARTFPAWTTILTGLPPTQSGVRDNLSPQNLANTNASLAHRLRAAGYRTVYATDDTRFSNIGPAFGFDQIVGPQPGLADFLLGAIADQPLLNFALQIPHAEWLFPSLVGNRAVAHAYRPSRFIRRVADALGTADDRPSAIFIHLCLAHWPYRSAETPPGAGSDPDGPYLQSVRELDTQLAGLLAMLRKQGYLTDNTLSVVLADHGEETEPAARLPKAVERVNTTLAPPSQLGGHGGSLLLNRQWQVFLMFSGKTALGPVPAGRSAQLASLSDVAPTILGLLDIPDRQAAEHPPLDVLSAVTRHPQAPDAPARTYVAMETGFRPKNFDPLHPDENEALGIALRSYRIVPDGRLEMRPDTYEEMIDSKDFGVTDGQNVLAVMSTKGGSVLVEARPDTGWRLFDTQTPVKSSAPPLLLQSACAEREFRSRISAWCAPDER